MLLDGSCHCQAVRFRCESRHPVPYQRCYCGICRKAGGGGGFLINIEADATTLVVEGREHVEVYRAEIERDGVTRPSRHERHFCVRCGSHLWAFNSRWPELLHPVAGAIDTALPAPAARVHMMVGSKAPWVDVDCADGDESFDEYPARSLADWHRDHGLDVS
jgi:hypothetical protein